MKTYLSKTKHLFIIIFFTICTACNSQQKNIKVENLIENSVQIGNYVVDVFEDSNGNLWFGTLEKGVAKYDGKKLTYLTIKDGLPSNRIVNIIEDNNGVLWFGTGEGLSKFDNGKFTNFTTEDGICNNSISNLLIDSKGNFWIGTWNGVCKFDGEKFIKFPVPTPTIETKINEDTKNWITEIMEDSKGNIWIGKDGYGACKFDGKSFKYFTKKDGLNSNNVQKIIEDKNGDIWFGTRVAEKDNANVNNRTGKGGVAKFNGKNFINYPKIKGFNKNDVYEIYKDDLDNLWISTIKNGLYKYDGKTFKNYAAPKTVMSVLKDKKSKIWLGCAGGLFAINSEKIVNVTTTGPWK